MVRPSDDREVCVGVRGRVLDVISILHGGRGRGPSGQSDTGEAALGAEALQVSDEGLKDDGPLLAAD